MKCPKCNVDNRDKAKFCSECGFNLRNIKEKTKKQSENKVDSENLELPLWRPTWKWHLKTLSIIYAALLIIFFMLNILLKPYLRQIPKDITPWLNKLPENNANEKEKSEQKQVSEVGKKN